MKRADVIRYMLALEIIFIVLLPSLASANDGFITAFPIERDEMTLDRLAQPNTYFDKAGRRRCACFGPGIARSWRRRLGQAGRFRAALSSGLA